ncbi:hypothetical protein CsSME_00054170 [Camellia sinensis var. sinensis]
MGSRKTISELRSMKKSHVRKYQKVDYGSTPQRRSARLNRLIDDSIATSDHIRFRRSNRLRGTHGEPISPHKGKLGLFGKSEEMPSSEREEKRPEVLDRPCASETRISVYPSVSRLCSFSYVGFKVLLIWSCHVHYSLSLSLSLSRSNLSETLVKKV